MCKYLLRVVLIGVAVDGARLLRNVHNKSAELGAETVPHVPMYMYKQDCFKSRPVLLQGNRSYNPGAGMTPSNITPFETVLKDGYMKVDCVKDSMYYHGDKFGNNKFSYKQGPISNTSIVRYDDLIPKMDRVSMSPAVCFSFCRTVPEMNFFGILNGRHCYCTPFYKAMADDNKVCASVCEGSPTELCGSKTKSVIFEMHLCQKTGQEVQDALAKLENVTGSLQTVVSVANHTATNIMQKYGKVLRDMFGQIGDPAAAGLCHEMMMTAGEVLQAVAGGAAIESQMAAIEDAYSKLQLNPPLSYEDTVKAEKMIKSMKTLAKQVEQAKDAIHGPAKEKHISADAFKIAFGDNGTVSVGGAVAFKGFVNASAQYYQAMYFVDKEFLDVPSTCGGDTVGSPMLATEDGCATACDMSVHSCVGYQIMASSPEDPGFCYLFSKMKTVQYYTGCNKTQKDSGCTGGFECKVKFSKFDGTTLKPDPSGKCDRCLKAATKADRCFDVPVGFIGCEAPTTTTTTTTLATTQPPVGPPPPPTTTPEPTTTEDDETKVSVDPCGIPFVPCL